jgi:peptidoglycan/LPS O-acetylase OafA/YrhL
VISAFAIIVAWGNPKYYWQYPLYLMWAVALPSWLLGCVLAERVGSPRPQTAGHIWIWRLAVLGYSILAEMYFFHGPIPLSVPVLLTPFSVLSFFWIEREIEEFRLRPAPRTLEWCGKWSYSLYLVHPVVLALMLNLPLVEWISWPLRFAATMATALVFYFAVERPSHIFAKQVSKAAGARVIAI